MISLRAFPEGSGVRLGKREDICCFIDPPVRSVEFPHCTVIHEQDTQFRIFKTEMMENCRQKLFYSRETYFSTSLLIPYVNFHL